MEIQLSERVNRIKPSPTIAVAVKAAKLKASGKDIISLGAGEPDFATPNNIKEAAKDAIDDNFTRYTEVDGIPALKDAIINKFKRDNHLEYKPEQILVSCGAKHSIYNIFQAVLDAGHEVIIPSPYWTSYPDMVLLADAKPVILQAGIASGFKITPEQLQKAITPNTRAFIINSPNNPSGAAYTNQELAALGKVLLQHPEVIIISDEIYEHTYWADFPFSNILNACPELYERTILVNGVSKAYSMTGWRIGYAAGPEHVIKAMRKIQSQSTTNPCSISQKASVEALNGPQTFITEMNKEFKIRHDYFFTELKKIPGIDCLPASGAFYVLFSVIDLIDRLKIPNVTDDTSLAEHLINTVGVAMVPGSAFGAPGYMRASFAASMAELQEAIKRLHQALNANKL